MSKNLTYSSREPAFLQRLKVNIAPQDGRNNVQHARSCKSRLDMGEDDGPLVIDERGEIVEGGLEGMVRSDKDGSDREGDEKARDERGGEHGAGNNKDAENMGKQQIVEIGVGKKRKLGKVVGGDEGEKEKDGQAGSKQSNSSTKPLSNTEIKDDRKSGVEKPKKKKAKRINLSFNDNPE